MTVKEKVIREAIKRIEARIKKIDATLNANPLSAICSLRMELAEKMKGQSTEDFLSKEFGDYIKSGAKKEKELFALSKKQINETPDLITEKVKLESELSSLRSELWYMDKSNFRV